jgi:hypothetical protein
MTGAAMMLERAALPLALCSSLTAATLLLSSVSRAQGEPVVTGLVALGTGVEGADPGIGAMQWQRARTRLHLGGEWRGSESTGEAWGLYGLFELERSGSAGAELKYRRFLDWGLGGYVGPIAVLRPESLYGVHAGISYHLSFNQRLGLLFEGGFAGFPLGSDRPNMDSVVMWGTFCVGLTVGL